MITHRYGRFERTSLSRYPLAITVVNGASSEPRDKSSSSAKRGGSGSSGGAIKEHQRTNAVILPEESRRLLQQAGVSVGGGASDDQSTSVIGETVAPASDTLPVAEGIPVGVVGGGYYGGDDGGAAPRPLPSAIVGVDPVGGVEGPYRRRTREPNSFK